MADVRLTLRQRRTVYDFLPEPVPRRVLEEAIAAAVWAPNHGLTEPWRFYVPGEETQAALAEVYARLRADRRAEPGTSAWQTAFERARQRFVQMPGMVFVGCEQASDPVQRSEDEAAVACAIYGLLLALWSQGWASQWSTGPILTAPETRARLGVPETVRLMAVIYVGRAARVPQGRRTPWQEKTVFLP